MFYSFKATRSGAVTPSDTVEQDFDALYVGVTGDVTIQHTVSSVAVLYKAVPAGTILPVKGQIVKATGTTATNLVWMKG